MLRWRHAGKVCKSCMLRPIRTSILAFPLRSSTFPLLRTLLSRVHALPWRLRRSVESPWAIVRFWRWITPLVRPGAVRWGGGNDWLARSWYNGERGARCSSCPPYRRRKHIPCIKALGTGVNCALYMLLEGHSWGGSLSCLKMDWVCRRIVCSIRKSVGVM